MILIDVVIILAGRMWRILTTVAGGIVRSPTLVGNAGVAVVADCHRLSLRELLDEVEKVGGFGFRAAGFRGRSISKWWVSHWFDFRVAGFRGGPGPGALKQSRTHLNKGNLTNMGGDLAIHKGTMRNDRPPRDTMGIPLGTALMVPHGDGQAAIVPRTEGKPEPTRACPQGPGREAKWPPEVSH